jgi:hypothetical protein
MQPTGVSRAIFRFGASVSAFPLGNLVLALAANAGRWAALIYIRHQPPFPTHVMREM